MTAESTQIVAYLENSIWYTPDEVRSERAARSPKLIDANPYTLAMLHRRREYGRDVPEWIRLDKEVNDGR